MPRHSGRSAGLATQPSSFAPPAASERAPRPASIINPVVDFLLVGGLSLIVFLPLLLSGRTDLVIIGAGVQAWLAATINMPHFMASYALIYRSRETILRHKWASIYVPLILVAYSAVALWQSSLGTPLFVWILILVASLYLAWHYTGQVWGMMASYAYLDGARFERAERLLIRTGLRVLLAWHVTWVFMLALRDKEAIRPIYLAVSAATVVAFALGVVGILLFRHRTKKLPPARALVAWLAVFAWYAVMARDPKALFWVQIAHALQYLAFPIRVEMNRANEPAIAPRRLITHMAIYGAVLLGISWLISVFVPASAMSAFGTAFDEKSASAAPILILMIINIHHYFTDGVIWKISNPQVRNELFAHVRVPRSAASAASPDQRASRALRSEKKRSSSVPRVPQRE